MLQRRQFMQFGLGAIAPKPKRLSLYTDCRQVCIQPPKFWFGDCVSQERVCDDDLDLENFGKAYCDYGVILGMFYTPGDSYYLAGWNYFVHWTWADGKAITSHDLDDIAHETDLKRSDLTQPLGCR
jgi:hypothetical protein